MARTPGYAAALALAVAVCSVAAHAQASKDIHLHVSPRWKQCAIQLDPSLSQGAWHQFTQEAGLVAYFRPLTDARPMGRGRFEASLLQWQTGINDHDSAWNDTFVHPDSTHWLYEGSGLQFPGLMLRAGVSDRVDVGAYFTKNMESNYGFYGGQLQYNLANDVERSWGASARVSFVSLFGPRDVALTVFGMDAVASKTYTLSSWASIAPYAGVSAYLAQSRERSAAVNLADESAGGTQAMVGAVARIFKARVALELNSARVQSRSMKLGVSF